MNTSRIRILRPMCALFLTGAALASAPILANAQGDAIDAMVRFQQDRANCVNGATNEDRATCLREAGAALAQAKRGDLDNGESTAEFRRNMFQRCQPLPDEDRLACRARMQGMGTTSGSVGGGGILRELVIEEVTLPSDAIIEPDNSRQ
jgi:hypothetical protein